MPTDRLRSARFEGKCGHPAMITSFVDGTPNPPILRLHRDLLWRIIKLNTNIFSEKDSLQSIRHYSQVCRDWRNFILQTQSLWGKLVDLDDLQKGSDLWRDEVLRRSGTSLLWIKGDIQGGSRSRSGPILLFFSSLLQDHWERVQKLVVTFHSRKIDVDWGALCRSAPHLQVFKCTPHFPGTRDIFSNSLSPLSPIFSNNAASLMDFHVGELRFNLNAPWLSSLRVLRLSFPVTLLYALRILETTHHLEALHIDQILITETELPLPHVNLSRLNEINISCQFETTLKILEHVHSPDHCSLSLRVRDLSDRNLVKFDLKLEPLCNFMKRYFRHHKPESLSLHDFGRWFFLDNKHQGSFFSVSLDFWGLSRKAIANVYAALSIQDLSTIKEFNVDLSDSQSLPDSFKSFSSTLVFLDTLITNDDTLKILLDAHNGANQAFFPHLRMVKLSSINQPCSAETPIAVTFILSRLEFAHPISALDLTQCNPYYLKPMECLGEISGLEISWSSGYEDPNTATLRYSCGVNNSEPLCFPEWE